MNAARSVTIPLLDERVAGVLDDRPQARSVDADERVPEVDGDRRDGEAGRHLSVATLEGQMSRNGQYVHARALGRGV